MPGSNALLNPSLPSRHRPNTTCVYTRPPEARFIKCDEQSASDDLSYPDALAALVFSPDVSIPLSTVESGLAIRYGGTEDSEGRWTQALEPGKFSAWPGVRNTRTLLGDQRPQLHVVAIQFIFFCRVNAG